MREVATTRNNYEVVIECRPTTPDVQVTLQAAIARVCIHTHKMNINDVSDMQLTSI